MRLKYQWAGLAVAVTVLMFQNSVAAGDNAGKKRAMTVEDMIRLQTPSNLVVSPDGTLLAYVLSGRDLESNSSRSSIQLIDLATGKQRQITAGGTREGNPNFTLPGDVLSFTSNVFGTPQLFAVPLKSDVPPQPVTELPSGVSSPKITRDGKRIVFLSSVYPDCADSACNKERAEAAEKNPVKAQVYDHLMYRHWDSWKDGKVDHLFVLNLEGGEIHDAMPGNTWGVTGGWSVSPDGRFVVYTSKDPDKEELTTNTDLFELSIDGEPSEPRRVTSNPAMDGNPVYSPDGQWILYHSQEKPGFESDRFRLTLLPAYGGTPKTLAADLDQWIMTFGWFADSTNVWFTAYEQGREVVYVTDISGSAPRLVLGGATFTDVVLSPDNQTFFAVRQTLAQPMEVWTAPVATGGGKALTGNNAWLLQEVELARVEEVWWEGAAGTQVHGFLLFPPGTSKDKANPFLMLIHGGPQGMWEDSFHPRWNAQLFAAPGYVTLLPNPRGSCGYGQPFVDQVSRNWGSLPYEDLMKGVDFLIAKGWVDPQRMCAGGGSYGGYMANWILGNTDRFQCLFSHAGVYDLDSMYGSTEELWFPEWEYGGMPWNSQDYQKWSPSNLVKNFKTPMLVIHGAFDFRVPESQAMQLFTALQRLGVPSKFLYFPDESHFVVKPKNTQLWYQTIHAWLAQWLAK